MTSGPCENPSVGSEAAGAHLPRAVAVLRIAARSRRNASSAQPPAHSAERARGGLPSFEALPFPAVFCGPLEWSRGALSSLGHPSANSSALPLLPGLRPQDPVLLAAVDDAVRSGEPVYACRVFPFSASRPDGCGMGTVSATRHGDGVLLTWAEGPEQALAAEAQRVARIGWAQWNLLDRWVRMSSGLGALLGLPGGGWRSPTDLFAAVAPNALGRLHHVIEDVLQGRAGEQGRTEVTLLRGAQAVAVVVEAVRSGDGGAVDGLRVVVQDITDLTESRRRLLEQQGEALRQRRRADTEHELVSRLQEALQPRAAAASRFLGLATAVAYRPAEATVGGDWYKIRVLPENLALLAVGDARGHGLDAVALMSKLRHALAGLAFTGGRVEQLGAWLNEIAYDEGPESTATAVIAHYYPERRLLRWICAGHPPPVLVRGGRAELLTPAVGPPLGVLPKVAYQAVKTVLRPGDTVLLYTDGLIERRDQDIDRRLDALAAAAAEHAASDSLEMLVDGVVRAMSGPLSEDDATLLAFRLL